MKTKNLIIYVVLVLIILFVWACKKESDDTTPPGKIEVTNVIPTNGGAIIEYSLPEDNDVLFVKAKYVNSVGHEVFKVSSHYLSSIEVDGFNDTLPKNIELFAVDHHNNASESVEAEVTPLVSFIHLVQESMVVESELGGVSVSWSNASNKTVFVYLYYKGPDIDTFKILSSNFAEYSFYVGGLDSVEYEFSAMIEDLVGNKTDLLFVDKAIPKFEQKIDKSSWTLISNLSVDGNAWEGVTQNFWDDVIDHNDNPNDNSYFMISRDNNGGALNYPLDIVIDLHKYVIANRFKIWQRAYWYSDAENQGVSAIPYYYQSENLKSFKIYLSNDLQTWTLTKEFEIHDPKDDDGNVPQADLVEALNGHMFTFDQVTEPFRYLKFSITSGFGSEIYVNGSEITIYGLDDVDI
ncbi:MAG: DUF4959 domain-containing protein [Bacteroidales bacterium]|nr:DUF4959 domain-containing protein [Bacteroidales bacterium]MCF8454365.1 DUF4959 domain-containing protein [Bacteroidales bacterium]